MTISTDPPELGLELELARTFGLDREQARAFALVLVERRWQREAAEEGWRAFQAAARRPELEIEDAA